MASRRTPGLSGENLTKQERREQALSRALAEAGALDESVLLTAAGCCYPCNRAPVVVVQPDMEWLGPVTPDDVPALVKDLTRGSLSARN